jgi:cation transport ATPase
MGFDLFMGGLAVALAALATWLIILFFRSPSPSRSAPEQTPREPSNPHAAYSNRSAAQGTSNDEQTSDSEQHHNRMPSDNQTAAQISHVTRLLILAVALTVIVFIPSLLNHCNPSLIPDWMVNPWVQAVISTPTMFLCGAPIHRRGWQALSRRTPDVNSLISLGATAAFIYSLAICVAGGQFPAGSRHAYFTEVNAVIALALAIELVELHILHDIEILQTRATNSTSLDPTASAAGKKTSANGNVTNNNGQTLSAAQATAQSVANRAFDTFVSGISKLSRFTRTFVIAVMVIAVWTFALLLVFGPQPRLTFALSGGVGVLVIAGFVLAILALALIANGRRKAQYTGKQ